MTHVYWMKKMRALARHLADGPFKTADDPFVDAVAQGMHEGFITTDRAVQILTHVERLPDDWRP